ncbi:MAG: hypothetical protein ABIQ93_08060 [Saprospiraceae bacterium]
MDEPAKRSGKKDERKYFFIGLRPMRMISPFQGFEGIKPGSFFCDLNPIKPVAATEG